MEEKFIPLGSAILNANTIEEIIPFDRKTEGGEKDIPQICVHFKGGRVEYYNPGSFDRRDDIMGEIRQILIPTEEA